MISTTKPFDTFYGSQEKFKSDQCSPDYAKNKGVIALFENYSQELLKETKNKAIMGKTYRTRFGELLSGISLMYEKELDTLDSKPISELQVLDYKPATVSAHTKVARRRPMKNKSIELRCTDA